MTNYPAETIYEIYWEGPYTHEELAKYADEQPIFASYWTLYALYDDHPLYGRGVLTYLGQAFDQGVTKRTDRDNVNLNDPIYVGTVYKFENWSKSQEIFDRDWESQSEFIIKKVDNAEINTQNSVIISALESLLIFALQPAYNIKNKSSANQSWPYRIFNTGNLGDLPSEVSGHFALAKPLRLPDGD